MAPRVLTVRPRRESGRVAGLAVLLPLLGACSSATMPMLNPVGDVTTTILELLTISTIVMAVIIVPVIVGTLWIVWRYRDRSDHRGYDPQFDHSPVIDKVTFYVPLVTIAVLGALTWVYTHRLDPYRVRPGGDSQVPYEIQAIGLDYKWLFVYPQAGVATVNELVAPTGRAVTIRITSDPMMTSLFIPSLISQIYAMPGMETRANFMAPKTAELDGANAMYSGPEFFTQRFKTRLVDQPDFDAWLKKVGGGAGVGGAAAAPKVEPVLDFGRYKALSKRTDGYPVTYFGKVEGDLFAQVVRQYQPQYRLNTLPVRVETSNATTGAGPAAHQRH